MSCPVLGDASDRAFDVASLRAELGDSLGNPGIRIAILDGTADTTHPTFAGAKLTSHELFAGEPISPATGTDRGLHGTHIVSIVLGQPGTSTPGLAPACTALSIPIFGGGRLTCSQLDLARGLALAAELGVHIVNISGGELTRSAEPEPLLARSLAACAERDMLIVAAAGNEGCDCLHLPAAAAEVLAVGAADADGAPLPMSNWGAAYRSNGLLAPGSAINGAVPGGGAQRRSGTSYAAAVVTGVSARLLSEELERTGRIEPRRIGRALLEGADRARSTRDLRGRLSIRGARKVLQGGKAMSESVESQGDPIVVISPPANSAAGLSPSCGCDKGCGCGSDGPTCTCAGQGQMRPRLVYALGAIGYDFVSEARRDSIVQEIDFGDPRQPEAIALANYLARNPEAAEAVTWTLSLDQTPIYALQPSGAYAAKTYEYLMEALHQTATSDSPMFAVGGTVMGSVALLSGQTVPMVVPSNRALLQWRTDELLTRILGERPGGEPPPERAEAGGAEGPSSEPARPEAPRLDGAQRDAVQSFFNIIYYDRRNLGVLPEERALNYSVTNAWHAVGVLEKETKAAFELDSITTRPSPICRPGSDCHDVVLKFYDPENTNRPVHTYRYTVDVSDVVPVLVGPVRYWSSRV